MPFGFSRRNTSGYPFSRRSRHREGHRSSLHSLRNGRSLVLCRQTIGSTHTTARIGKWFAKTIVAVIALLASALTPVNSQADYVSYLYGSQEYSSVSTPDGGFGPGFTPLGNVLQNSVQVGNDTLGVKLGIGGSFTASAGYSVGELHFLGDDVSLSGPDPTQDDYVGETFAVLNEVNYNPYIEVNGSANFNGYLAPGDTMTVGALMDGGPTYNDFGAAGQYSDEYIETFTTPGPISFSISVDSGIQRAVWGGSLRADLSFSVDIRKGSDGGTTWVDPTAMGIGMQTAPDPSDFPLPSTTPEPSSLCLFAVAAVTALGFSRRRTDHTSQPKPSEPSSDID